MDQWEAYLKFRDGLISILDERFYPAAWLDAEVYAGFVKLFHCDDAAILAELKVYPSELMEVRGVLATGRLESIEDILIPQAEAWGKAEGCFCADISSREGWLRRLRKRGYSLHQVSIRKEL